VRSQRLRQNREWYLADIAKLPLMAVTYAQFARGVRPTVAIVMPSVRERKSRPSLRSRRRLGGHIQRSSGNGSASDEHAAGQRRRVMPDYHRYRYEVRT